MAYEASSEIDEAAAAWAARVDRGPLSAADNQALEAWLAADIRHHGAFARMRAIALHTERAKALGPSLDVQALAGRPGLVAITRRNALWMGAGLAAAGLAAAGLAAIASLAVLGGVRRYETGLGEMSVIPMEDGSVMTLNTASKVEVRFTRDLRSVGLVEGEALFEVAKDRARPFVVSADGATARAVGTSFAVRRLGEAPVAVLVREGVVEVRAAAAAKAVRLGANMLTEVASGASELRAVALASGDVDRALAWREGRLAFEGETLGEAAADFARYSRTRIVIDDPDVRKQEITGLFAANDPVSFARAAALSLGLHAETEEGQVRISR